VSPPWIRDIGIRLGYPRSVLLLLAQLRQQQQ